MLLFIDVDSQKLVQVAGSRAELTSVAFKRGDSARVEVQFVSGTVVQELSGTTITGSFGLKESGKYDTASCIVGPASWTKEGTGTATKYVFEPDFATSALADLLEHGDADDTNDVVSVALMGEISWTIDGAIYSTQTFEAVVHNDVLKGGEGLSVPVPDQQVQWLSENGIAYDDALTDYTGGAATDLDSVETVDLDVGALRALRTSEGLHIYRLTTGPAPEDVPTVIRPDDYHLSTNSKHWALLDFFGKSLRLQLASTGTSTLTGTSGASDVSSELPGVAGILAVEPSIVTATPTTGFTITVDDARDQAHYLTPAGTLATGTFQLPAVANARVGQLVELHSTEEVSALTLEVAGSGTISGAALSTAAAATSYAWRCVSVSGNGTWIRLY